MISGTKDQSLQIDFADCRLTKQSPVSWMHVWLLKVTSADTNDVSLIKPLSCATQDCKDIASPWAAMPQALETGPVLYLFAAVLVSATYFPMLREEPLLVRRP